MQNNIEASVNQISIIALAGFLLVVIVATLLINRFVLKLKTNKQLSIAFTRMLVQLALAGFYLTYIFKFNNTFINLLYLLLMLIAASSAAINNSSLRLKVFLPQLFVAMLIPLLLVLGTLLFLIIKPSAETPVPFFSARYLIPLGGMLLGNSLNSNIISLRTFFISVHENKELYQSRLMQGATKKEALRPWIDLSLKNTLAPITATMANMGLVSLPGMMTGQLLQGANPQEAVLYQIAIVVGIFAVQYASVLLTLGLSIRFRFDCYDQLQEGLFKK